MRSQTGVWERVNLLNCDTKTDSVRDALEAKFGIPK